MDEFRPGSQDSIERCRKIAATFLGDKLNDSEVYDSNALSIVYGIGHCHMWVAPFQQECEMWCNFPCFLSNMSGMGGFFTLGLISDFPITDQFDIVVKQSSQDFEHH